MTTLSQPPDTSRNVSHPQGSTLYRPEASASSARTAFPSAPPLTRVFGSLAVVGAVTAAAMALSVVAPTTPVVHLGLDTPPAAALDRRDTEPPTPVVIEGEPETLDKVIVEEVEHIAFDEEEVPDPYRFVDTPVEVVQEGEPGEIARVYRVTTVDGEETERVLVAEAVTREPVNRVASRGTRVRPAGVPADWQGGDIPDEVWRALAQCESGGNPSIVSSNGLFHGLYQFMVPTWQSVGGVGLPSQATPEEQRARAEILQARSGWGQWPACARRLGLR